jgi:hypothetical protein
MGPHQIFFDENIVKTGDDKYFAQNMGDGELTMEQVKQGLVDYAKNKLHAIITFADIEIINVRIPVNKVKN